MRRPAERSARSRLRNLVQAHPHIFSTGLRSGDFAGNLMNSMFLRRYAAMLGSASRNDSLSQKTFQGPRFLPGRIRLTSSYQLTCANRCGPFFAICLAAPVPQYVCKASDANTWELTPWLIAVRTAIRHYPMKKVCRC